MFVYNFFIFYSCTLLAEIGSEVFLSTLCINFFVPCSHVPSMSWPPFVSQRYLLVNAFYDTLWRRLWARNLEGEFKYCKKYSWNTWPEVTTRLETIHQAERHIIITPICTMDETTFSRETALSLTCSWCTDDVALGLVCGLQTCCDFRSSILKYFLLHMRRSARQPSYNNLNTVVEKPSVHASSDRVRLPVLWCTFGSCLQGVCTMENGAACDVMSVGYVHLPISSLFQ